MKRGTGKEAVPNWQMNWPQKSPRIDIKFPILGFLTESEMTGYDLKRRFREPIGFFYRASDGSLYPALKRLEQDEMVTMRTERRGQRPRKIYSITEKGRKQFLHTLREPAQPIFVYDEAQVKIYFAHYDPEIALPHIEREHRFADALGSYLRSLLDDMKSRGASPIRAGMIEIGCTLVALKADLLERLAARLQRELRLRGAHIGAGSEQGRRQDFMQKRNSVRRSSGVR